jgi:hypothetical protein
LGHLVDLDAGQILTAQKHDTSVLRRNLGTLLVMLGWLAIEGSNCIVALGGPDSVDLGMAAAGLKKQVLEFLEDAPSGDTEGLP